MIVDIQHTCIAVHLYRQLQPHRHSLTPAYLTTSRLGANLGMDQLTLVACLSCPFHIRFRGAIL
jgi:hypothetical protein